MTLTPNRYLITWYRGNFDKEIKHTPIDVPVPCFMILNAKSQFEEILICLEKTTDITRDEITITGVFII